MKLEYLQVPCHRMHRVGFLLKELECNDSKLTKAVTYENYISRHAYIPSQLTNLVNTISMHSHA